MPRIRTQKLLGLIMGHTFLALSSLKLLWVCLRLLRRCEVSRQTGNFLPWLFIAVWVILLLVLVWRIVQQIIVHHVLVKRLIIDDHVSPATCLLWIDWFLVLVTARARCCVLLLLLLVESHRFPIIFWSRGIGIILSFRMVMISRVINLILIIVIEIILLAVVKRKKRVVI